MSLFFRGQAPIIKRNVLMPSQPLLAAPSGYDTISVTTMEQALQSIAVHSTVDLACSMISELPFTVFSGRREVPTPSYLLDPEGEGYGWEDCSYKIIESWMLRGNVWSDVVDASSRGGFPTQIELIHPDLVSGQLVGGQPRWSVGGKYEADRRIWHTRTRPIAGVVMGASMIALHAQQIGYDLTLGQFGLQYFQDGAMPGAVLQNTDEKLDEGVARVVKARFMAAIRGNREPAVLGKGWTYQPITIKPNESQFLQSRALSAAECCRMFGPGYAEIFGYESSTKGGSLTYANLQSREAHLLVFSLSRWVTRLERFYSAMLPRPQKVKLNVDALLRSTTLERFQAYQIATGRPWMDYREVRELEDLEPREVEMPAATVANESAAAIASEQAAAGGDSGGGTGDQGDGGDSGQAGE